MLRARHDPDARLVCRTAHEPFRYQQPKRERTLTTEVPELLPAGLEVVVEGIDVPEGPAWGPDGKLYFVSAGTGDVLVLESDGKSRVVANTGGRPNGLAFSADGVLHIADAGRRAILRLTESGEVEEFATEHESRQFGGPNDLAFLPNGDLLFTDPARTPVPDPAISPVYRVRPDGTTGIFVSDLAYPNGIDMGAAGKGVFIAEMRAHRLIRFNFDANGNPLEERLVRRFREPASPDGMAVDTDGNVFQALPGINSLALVGSEGDLVELYYSANWAPSNIAFGGPHMKSVFVTSELQGRIFRFEHSVPGVDLLHVPASDQ